MTFGEQLYFGLVVAAFAIFGATLAVVASRTNRHTKRKTKARHDETSLSRA